MNVRTLREIGLALFGSAVMVGDVAWLHMRGLWQNYAVICGSGGASPAHCPACYAGAALLMASLGCFLAAARPAPATSR